MNRSDGSLVDVGDLLSVRGAQRDMVRAGDFTGDGFSDIVYVDQKGSLRRINHDANGPTEQPMKYDSTPLL